MFRRGWSPALEVWQIHPFRIFTPSFSDLSFRTRARTCPCAAWLFQWPGRKWHHFVRPRHPVARRKSIPFAPCEVEATQTHRTGREVVLSAKLCSTIAGPAIGVRYSVQPFHPRAAYGRPTNFRVCELVIRVSLRIETTQNLLHSFRRIFRRPIHLRKNPPNWSNWRSKMFATIIPINSISHYLYHDVIGGIVISFLRKRNNYNA